MKPKEFKLLLYRYGEVNSNSLNHFLKNSLYVQRISLIYSHNTSWLKTVTFFFRRTPSSHATRKQEYSFSISLDSRHDCIYYLRDCNETSQMKPFVNNINYHFFVNPHSKESYSFITQPSCYMTINSRNERLSDLKGKYV